MCPWLQAGLARFVKHTAAIVVRADKGFVDLVRAMAAGVLKTLAVWVEKEIAGVDGEPERQRLVVKVAACAPGLCAFTSLPQWQCML